jgi:hypothetical protein
MVSNQPGLVLISGQAQRFAGASSAS